MFDFSTTRAYDGHATPVLPSTYYCRLLLISEKLNGSMSNPGKVLRFVSN